MTDIRLFGYSDPLTDKAGQPFDFMISAEGTGSVNAEVVRLVHGDFNKDGPGFIEEKVQSDISSKIDVKRQYTQVGSFIAVQDKDNLFSLDSSFTIHAFIWPTLPGNERQTIMGKWSVTNSKGYALGINPEGKLEFWIGDGKKVDKVASEVILIPKVWLFVAVTYNSTSGETTIVQESVQNSWNSLIGPVTPYNHNSVVKEKLRIKPAYDDIDFLLAGSNEENKERGKFVSMLFNGKIDRCGVINRELTRKELDGVKLGHAPNNPLAYWDTTQGYTDRGIGQELVDVGPNKLNGKGINRPVRGMTGWNWTGRDDSFRLNPSQYGGISFHDDAITDCNWDKSLSWTPPAKLKSGVYALKISSGNAVDRIPFIVRPQKPKAKIAVQMSTFTYLAYANERLSFEAQIAQAIVAHTPVISEKDIEYQKLAEFGLSTYDHHSDGAGVCFTSWKRPIINLRPGHRMAGMTIPWALPADLSLLWWLEKAGYDYDLITDHDLDREGVSALEPYKVILNVTHPEYYSEGMLDATEQYLVNGGRVMYIGGNGYYWVTACLLYTSPSPRDYGESRMPSSA